MTLNAYFNRSFISHFRWSSASSLFFVFALRLLHIQTTTASSLSATTSSRFVFPRFSFVLLRLFLWFTQCETIEFLILLILFLNFVAINISQAIVDIDLKLWAHSVINCTKNWVIPAHFWGTIKSRTQNFTKMCLTKPLNAPCGWRRGKVSK